MTCSEFVHRLDAFVDGETSLEESCDIAENRQYRLFLLTHRQSGVGIGRYRA